jgi:hypothetical protein
VAKSRTVMADQMSFCIWLSQDLLEFENGGDYTPEIVLQTIPKKRRSRFLSEQADPFTGVKGEEKVGLLRSE